jgi:hypothetical protein
MVEAVTGEEAIMSIDIRRFGMALGATSALVYLGCVLAMVIVSRETAIFFFNSLFHGIDFDSIIRTNMPFWEMAMGIVVIVILGWLTGATIAAFYNLGRGE